MEDNKNIFKIIATIALILAIASLAWTYSLSKKISPVAPDGQTSDETNENSVAVSADDDPIKGDPNAPVTIIEFSDFQCPFCSRFVTGAMPQIEEKYIKTGKAKLIFRDFPILTSHPNAQKSAEAAQCAADQGKFWEMHNKLFANQAALNVNDLKKYARELALDANKFNQCLDSGKYSQEVQKDLADGTSYGVSGTPSFFIAKGDISVNPEIIRQKSLANEFIIKSGTGTMIIGAQPFGEFEKVIEEELKK